MNKDSKVYLLDLVRTIHTKKLKNLKKKEKLENNKMLVFAITSCFENMVETEKKSKGGFLTIIFPILLQTISNT